MTEFADFAIFGTIFFVLGFRAGVEAYAYRIHNKHRHERLFQQDSRRVKLECKDEADKKTVIKFIQAKHRCSVRYLKNHGILDK